MPTLLVVDKSGTIKESNVKSVDGLYKKAGFKTAEGFEKVHDWTIEKTTVSLYGKTTGRAGQENKYDFPPPVDNVLFFGSCILLVENGNLTKSQWEKIYETLFGGFEDLASDESEEDDDDDIDDDLPKTKDGYAKDGFIVDDDEDDDEEEDDEEEEEDDEEEEEPIIITKKPAKKPTPKKNKPTLFEKIETLANSKDDLFLDCTSELEEELYE